MDKITKSFNINDVPVSSSTNKNKCIKKYLLGMCIIIGGLIIYKRY